MDTEAMLKKAKNELTNKIEQLEKDVAGLKKQKENFGKDIDELKGKKKALQEETNKLDEKIQASIVEALAAEKEKIRVKEEEIDALKNDLQVERVKASELSAEAEGKVKSNKKKESSLNGLLKVQDGANKEVEALKNRLENVVDIVKEILKDE